MKWTAERNNKHITFKGDDSIWNINTYSIDMGLWKSMVNEIKKDLKK